MLSTFPPRHTKHASLIRILLLVFLLVAFFLRISDLDIAPPGIHFDEGANGVDALRIGDGITPVFFAENNGREPLFIYLVYLFVGVLGNSIFALRLPAVFVGTMAVASTYMLGRKLLGEEQGLLGAGFLAVTFWVFSLSRISYRANLLLALLPICIFLLWKCREDRSLSTYIVAGFMLALIQYTYTASHFVPILVVILAIDWRRHLTRQGLLVGMLVAIILTIPLLIAIYLNPDEGTYRIRQLWIFSRPDPWSLLGRQLIAHLGIFGISGDPIWLHNIPGRPPISWFVAPVFVMGLLLGGRHAGARTLAWLIFVLIWSGILAVSLEIVPPNHLRILAIAPAVFLLAAHGIVHLIGQFRGQSRIGIALLVGLALICVDGVQSIRDYWTWQSARQTYEQYDADMTAIAAKIDATPDTTFVIPLSWDWPRSNYWSIDYLTKFARNYVVVEPPFEIELPKSEHIGLVRWDAGMHVDADPQHRLDINLRLNGFQPKSAEQGATYHINYFGHAPAHSRSASLEVNEIAIEGGVRFTNAVFYCFLPEESEKEQLAVDLTWQTDGAYSVDLSASLRLASQASENIVTQVDSWLLNANGKAARSWGTPDAGVQFFEFSEVDVTPGTYELWIVPYETETLQPVPLTGGETPHAFGHVDLPLCIESP